MDPPIAEPAPVLSDGTVTLRPPTLDDRDDVVRTCQDPEVQQWTTVPSPYSADDADAWLQRTLDLQSWWANPTWVITIPETAGYSGAIDLRPDGVGGCLVGYLLAPWARGKGHGARALRVASTWAITQLGVSVVQWECYAGNEASRRTALAAGFRIHDATMRRWLPQRGVRRDAWMGELLPEDLVTPAVSRARAIAARRDGMRPAGPSLTARERDVLAQLAMGKSNRDLAKALGITENTVKNHVRSVLEKLNAQSRSEAVVIALKAGLVTLQR
jgi:DNA-binding CsgD family transcriptional regulator/RimJ/RimL family protein N-acetyltransferase